MTRHPREKAKKRRPAAAPRREVDDRPEVTRLFANLKASLPRLRRVRTECDYEDELYRFYHQSFKVYGLQRKTLAIVAALQALAPDRELNEWFTQIVQEGTGIDFKPEHNKKWLRITRPMLEAFFHARYFLDMAILYGKELTEPPLTMDSGWAAILYLYDLG